MKAYVAVSGIIFGLLVLMHVWRAFLEGAHLLAQPDFLLFTLAALALFVWAMRLLARTPKA